MRYEHEETTIEVAVRLGRLIADHVPADMCAAVFVFRNDPEKEQVSIGFNANTTVGLLRKWFKLWLRDTRPKKETRH